MIRSIQGVTAAETAQPITDTEVRPIDDGKHPEDLRGQEQRAQEAVAFNPSRLTQDGHLRLMVEWQDELKLYVYRLIDRESGIIIAELPRMNPSTDEKFNDFKVGKWVNEKI